ncbi:MAG: hypothetical protein OHK0039_38460 [Bacteroidia bacterium]
MLEVNETTHTLLMDSRRYAAEERYLHLLDHRPDWIRRIPLKHLASYLGITPESLSRIRRKIAQPNLS